jgi:hypothetical protein
MSFYNPLSWIHGNLNLLKITQKQKAHLDELKERLEENLLNPLKEETELEGIELKTAEDAAKNTITKVLKKVEELKKAVEEEETWIGLNTLPDTMLDLRQAREGGKSRLVELNEDIDAKVKDVQEAMKAINKSLRRIKEVGEVEVLEPEIATLKVDDVINYLGLAVRAYKKGKYMHCLTIFGEVVDNLKEYDKSWKDADFEKLLNMLSINLVAATKGLTQLSGKNLKLHEQAQKAYEILEKLSEHIDIAELREIKDHLDKVIATSHPGISSYRNELGKLSAEELEKRVEKEAKGSISKLRKAHDAYLKRQYKRSAKGYAKVIEVVGNKKNKYKQETYDALVTLIKVRIGNTLEETTHKESLGAAEIYLEVAKYVSSDLDPWEKIVNYYATKIDNLRNENAGREEVYKRARKIITKLIRLNPTTPTRRAKVMFNSEEGLSEYGNYTIEEELQKMYKHWKKFQKGCLRILNGKIEDITKDLNILSTSVNRFMRVQAQAKHGTGKDVTTYQTELTYLENDIATAISAQDNGALKDSIAKHIIDHYSEQKFGHIRSINANETLESLDTLHAEAKEELKNTSTGYKYKELYKELLSLESSNVSAKALKTHFSKMIEEVRNEIARGFHEIILVELNKAKKETNKHLKDLDIETARTALHFCKNIDTQNHIMIFPKYKDDWNSIIEQYLGIREEKPGEVFTVTKLEADYSEFENDFEKIFKKGDYKAAAEQYDNYIKKITKIEEENNNTKLDPKIKEVSIRMQSKIEGWIVTAEKNLSNSEGRKYRVSFNILLVCYLLIKSSVYLAKELLNERLKIILAVDKEMQDKGSIIIEQSANKNLLKEYKKRS